MANPVHSAATSRFLITGGNGFIGRHVAEEILAHGHDVVMVSRTGKAALPGCTAIACDLLAPDAPERLAAIGADGLIHLAWETTHGKFWNAPENLDWVAATLRIARAFRAAGGRRMVGIGTCIEYDTAGDTPLDEIATPRKPTLLYGIAKNATFEILGRFAALSGLEFAWARLFHLFGPDEKPDRLVPAVIAALLAGREARTTAGTQTRNFIHAADAGRAIAAIALADLTGPVNIGAYAHTSVVEVATIIAEIIGRPELLRLGALPPRAGEPASLIPKLDRLAALGFTPTFDLASGLADVIRQLEAKSGT
jgi:nucleoside-diphosphate-sugar epimerase